MEITSRINRLAAFARTGGEQGTSASDDFASQVQGSSDNTATQDRHQQLLVYSYRRKMPLMATGLMPEKSQAEFQAVGLAEEWQRVKADWQAKVAGMDEVSRAAAGVSLPDEEGDAASVSAGSAASPVASTSSAVAASPVENEAPVASASTAVQASASAESDSEPAAATQDRHQQLLVYSYRRKMPLMATGLMPEKSQAEFQAVGLAEEWQRVKADWQAKVAGMDEVSRAAAGVSLPDEE